MATYLLPLFFLCGIMNSSKMNSAKFAFCELNVLKDAKLLRR